MTRNMRTTTLIIETPVDYDRLTSQFNLIRYTVPEKFKYLKDSNKYRRLHVQLKEQLDYPYRFFTHDKPTPLGIYVLYEPGVQISDLKLDFLSSNEPLLWNEARFEQLPLHLILKLLQANYFKSRRTTEFVSQSQYYIQAKVRKSEIICLEIELKGDLNNVKATEGQSQEFKVIGKATRFRKVDKMRIKESYKRFYPYFQRLSPRGGQSFFSQLPPDEIDDFLGDIYSIWTDSSERATLDYHSQLRPEHSRGKILYDFTKNFVEYLSRYGISAQQKVRKFIPYRPPKGNAELPIADLDTIYLFDNRLSQKIVPFEDYHRLLAKTYQHINFEIVENIDANFSGPLLILQDYNAEDFEEDGILAGQPDPYKQLYQHEIFRALPKQSINVNPNEPDEHTDAEDYLIYSLPSFRDNEGLFEIRFPVCFNQLFLKDLIFNQRDVIGCLPCLRELNQDQTLSTTLLQNYAFIRKRTYDRVSYRTLLYITDGRLMFADLRDPNERSKLYELLAQYELDWDDDLIEPFNQKYLSPDREEEEITRYDFIIGPGQVVEIEDLDERVLYEYDTILERKAELDRPYSIETLKLARHYDTLRRKDMLSLSELLSTEQTGATKRSKFSSLSKAFFDQLQIYDDFLDALLVNRIDISFNELTSGENMVRIGHIFNIEPDSDGKYNRRKFKKYYQQLGLFLSDKAPDVQSYSGIWYDAENSFMVGSPQSLQDTQPRAHLIRKFHVYKGRERFDINTFMETLGVRFVRYQQYTVYPYFFHLIDLYVETRLR